MRFCNKCRRNRKESSFSKKGDSFQHQCKDCFNKWYAKHYRKNHEEILAKTNTNRALHRKKLRELVLKAKDKPCMDCGRSFPYYVMDLDHRVREDKEDHIGNMVARGVTVERLLAEIAKCDPVCANCHRERTFG